MAFHKFCCIGHCVEGCLRLIFILMNIQEHETASQIWQFGNDIALRRKFGLHFLVACDPQSFQGRVPFKFLPFRDGNVGKIHWFDVRSF